MSFVLILVGGMALIAAAFAIYRHVNANARGGIPQWLLLLGLLWAVLALLSLPLPFEWSLFYSLLPFAHFGFWGSGYRNNQWLLYGEARPFWRSFFGRQMAIAIVALLVLDVLRGSNRGLLLPFYNDPFQPTPIYVAYHLVFTLGCLVFVLQVMLLHGRNILMQKNLMYRTRLSLAWIGLVFICISYLTYAFRVFYPDLVWLAAISTGAMVFAVFLVILSMLPQSAMVWILRPIESARRSRLQRDYALLQKLYAAMRQIVPGYAPMPDYNSSFYSPLTRMELLLVELGDLRDLVLSHRTQPLRDPMAEAHYLADLLRVGMTIEKPAEHLPQLLPKNAARYFVTVAESLQSIRATSAS